MTNVNRQKLIDLIGLPVHTAIFRAYISDVVNSTTAPFFEDNNRNIVIYIEPELYIEDCIYFPKWILYTSLGKKYSIRNWLEFKTEIEVLDFYKKGIVII